VGLRSIIHPALDSVPTDLMRKYFRRVLEYERAYLEDKKAGKELEAAVKLYKSHSRNFFVSYLPFFRLPILSIVNYV
jgi:hypothetical protein